VIYLLDNNVVSELWVIDAMAVHYGATIATRNTKDFRHAQTLNPWTV